MKIKGTSVSPTLSDDLTSVSTSSYSGISPYLCLPPPVCSVHFGIEAFRWCIAGKATLRGVYTLLGIRWLQHQPSHAFDDVSTPVFDVRGSPLTAIMVLRQIKMNTCHVVTLGIVT
jgi:hypothetical protein